jgi:hypothetical protein
MARQLEDSQACKDGTFERHDSERYAAAAVAQNARSALALVPALTAAKILAKAKAPGPVYAAALASLNEGGSGLVASSIRDVRRMADVPVDGSDAYLSSEGATRDHRRCAASDSRG